MRIDVAFLPTDINKAEMLRLFVGRRSDGSPGGHQPGY
ncbi:hypothetical protein SPSIL_032220 [Sporomusa silvacetica DSM 10669]|uniref:Uncharacterized protein n=1 Tax=Sporomusa silvacetica DSM 10669 TaxID=1123289 RepID=A0ABZ3IN99_9FIRM|nr:hypothetical protein SPSIL_27950 [Sporomusa silvacetica DSM 10669]